MVTVPVRGAAVEGAAVAGVPDVGAVVGAVDAPGEEQAPNTTALASPRAPIRFERLSVTRWFLQVGPGRHGDPAIVFKIRAQHQQGP
jgi:hypothetical protein